jgi:membrane-associated protein
VHGGFWGFVVHFGYAGVFFGTAFEGTGMPAPVEIVFFAAGFLVARGKLNFVLVGLLGALGNTLGNTLGYAIGAYGGRPLVRQVAAWLGVSHGALARVEDWFQRYGPVTLVISRLIGITRTPAILGAGLGRMRFPGYVLWSFVADALWAFLWTSVGTFLGRRWAEWEVQHGAVLFLGLTVMALGAVFVAVVSQILRSLGAVRNRR